MGYLLLSDYGLVGNQSSSALISRLGSVDWFCLPWLDSPSHFGALRDQNQGGRFQIMPHGEFRSQQRYLQRTQILETTFETPHGSAVLRDWMPASKDGFQSYDPILYRELETIHGQIPWTMSCAPRFQNGEITANAERTAQGGVLFRGNHPELLAHLEATVDLRIAEDHLSAHSRFELGAGESARFAWSWGRREAHQKYPSWRRTAEFWHHWAHRCPSSDPTLPSTECPFAGPWHDLVSRSGLVLKGLSNRYAGSLAEAVMTPGSSERFAWLRDSALAVQGLLRLGHQEEARIYFSWLTQILARDSAPDLQAAYTLDGGRISSLATSVRPAAGFQLEIYGQVLLAAEAHRESLGSLPPGLWPLLVSIADYISQAWRRPDHAPWQLQGRAEHFVSSKLYCWVALDRASRLAVLEGEKPPHRWISEASQLRKTILQQGFDPSRGTFVRSFGDRELDPNCLAIPLVGFLPPGDSRVLSTLDKTISELGTGAFLRRSRTEKNGDLWSSFLLVSALARCGRVEEASDRLGDLVHHATPLGLFGEMVDPLTGETSGNFPSAAAHLSLIQAAWLVGQAKNQEIQTRFHQAAG